MNDKSSDKHILSSTHFFFLIFILVSIRMPCYATEPVIIDTSLSVKPIGMNLEYLEDRKKSLTVENFLSMSDSASHIWKQSDQETFAFGYTNSAYWIRFTVKNTSDKKITWHLEQNYTMTNYISVFVPQKNNTYREIKTGTKLNFMSRPIAHRTFVFPMQTDAGKIETYYMRFETEGSMNIVIRILSPEGFFKVKDTESIFLWGFYGILTLMVVYNFIIFLFVKDYTYLFHMLYNLSFMLVSMSLNGLASQYLWPDSIWWGNYCRPIFIGIIAAFLVQFARLFIQTNLLSPHIDKVFIVLFYLNIIAGMTTPIINNYQISIKTSILISAISVMYIFFVSAYLTFIKKSRQAAFFFTSFSFFCFGTILYELKSLGFIPENFATNYSMQLGAAAQVTLLSLGLADKINTMREDLKKKTDELQNININLEELVEERTTQLKSAQKKLIERAHQAGMSDISTGTLHNVGNILNSLMISTQRLERSIRNPISLTSYKKCNDGIREHADNLKGFIVNHPKSEKFIQLYLKLEESFIRDNEFLKEQVTRQIKMVEEIADVISSLHDYAGTASLSEEVTLSEVVEDALISKTSLFEEHGILVYKELNPTPQIHATKKKLEHILVNLFKNAAEAMETVPTGKKELHISTGQDRKTVFICVKDTGCGIREEELRKIFSHDFSTKDGRLGLGLHDCANFMTEMKGKITAESKGLDKGSTFLLVFQIS